MPVSINTSGQLESLLNKYKRVDFIFEFPGLSSEENQFWLEKVRQNYFACGCKTGSKFTMYALLSTVSALLYIYFFHNNKFSILVCSYSIVFIFIMAGVGKAVGKMIAYKKLRKTIDELKFILNKSQS